MSALENGLLVDIDNEMDIVQAGLDQSSTNFGRDIATSDCSSGHDKGCNGSRDAEKLEPGLDADSELEDTSPDISLSSQRTLRYCDVEQEFKGRLNSHSSDSFEALDEPSKKGYHPESAGLVSPNHSLAQNVSRVSADPSRTEEPQQERPGTSADHNEAIPESSNVPRPESLSLSYPLQDAGQKQNKSDSKRRKNTKVSEADIKKKDTSKTSQPVNGEDPDSHRADSDICLAQNLPQGTITRKGDMIQFVADDLMEKIKKSSPMSHTDTASNGSRRSSVRSTASASSSTSFATSSGVSRSPSSLCQQSPDDIPPIDASAVIDLENQANRVADSLDLMMGNIRNNLHKMSAITIGCQDAYKRSVDITCDSVDASIKAMYALMAKCEELSRSMKPVDQLALQIREIKRILDLFEAQMTDK